MKPLVRWAGGKSRLMPELLQRLPTTYNSYYEPFAGGAALFFGQFPIPAPKSYLIDANHELMNFYTVVREWPDKLIDQLRTLPVSETAFYAIRDYVPADQVERAARFFYLNKTCFNGLYRVNLAGKFNTPWGKYVDPDTCPASRIRDASRALASTYLLAGDYSLVRNLAERGAFVYFDPPYAPVSRTSNFTSYTATRFAYPEQAALARLFDELTARGVSCMLSNSDTPEMRNLYARHRVESIMAPRSIGGAKKPVAELLVRNY